jgi:hypothetical protein
MTEPTTAMEYLALLKLKHAEWDKLLKAEQERPHRMLFWWPNTKSTNFH